MEFEQLQKLEYRAQLQPWTGGPTANFGFCRSAYWAAFTLRNPADRPLPLVIRQGYLLIDQLDFWALDGDGQWQRLVAGDRLPFDSRGLTMRDFVFLVTLPAQSERTYYLCYAAQGSLNIGLSVSGETAFLSRLGLELLLGIYYDCFLVLVIYNLFLFIAVCDSAYVYCMGYALSYGFYSSVHNDISFQFLWSDNPWLANESLILLGLSTIFGIQFAREVCAGRQLAPRTGWVARTLMYSLIPLTLVVPFFSYRPMILIFAVLTLILRMVLLALGTISLLRVSISVRYFMAAWAALLPSVIVYLLKAFGLLPHSDLTQNAFQEGALIEMVLLPLALGARVSEIQKRGYTDELSRLYNRRYFDEQLPREFNFAAGSGMPLSLLELDHFKEINDRCGHRRVEVVKNSW